MVEPRVFYPDDLLRFEPVPQQMGDYPYGISREVGVELAKGFAISGWSRGLCVGCAGISEVWQHRAMAWALLGCETGRLMWPITKLVREALDLHPAKRIETTVYADFPVGRRWAEMLGFVCETPEPMQHYANGRAAYLYARIKP